MSIKIVSVPLILTRHSAFLILVVSHFSNVPGTTVIWPLKSHRSPQKSDQGCMESGIANEPQNSDLCVEAAVRRYELFLCII